MFSHAEAQFGFAEGAVWSVPPIEMKKAVGAAPHAPRLLLRQVNTPRMPPKRTRSIEAFPGEAVPFPGEDAYSGREMVEPWAAGPSYVEAPGAPTTSPRVATGGAQRRGAPFGAMLCDWLLFGVTGAGSAAQPEEEPVPAWTGMSAGRSPAKAPDTSATTGKVWDEKRQRFIKPKTEPAPAPAPALDESVAVQRPSEAGLSEHMEDHLERCRLEQEIGESQHTATPIHPSIHPSRSSL
jgi:hypothetical protein